MWRWVCEEGVEGGEGKGRFGERGEFEFSVVFILFYIYFNLFFMNFTFLFIYLNIELVLVNYHFSYSIK